MNFHWPDLKTEHANLVADKLKVLCVDLENRCFLNNDEAVDRFNGILEDANERKYYKSLNNTERKEEFANLVSIVNSIFLYFHSTDILKIRASVFDSNVKFFSYKRRPY